MEENNQYSQAMTKLLSTSYFKKRKNVQSWKEFNILTEKVSIKDKIGHLFVVDIFSTKITREKESLPATKLIHPFLKNIRI